MVNMEILTQIITNKIVIACFIAWLLSQIIKATITIFKEKKFDITQLIFGVGGMPSSHTSTTCCLTTAILLTEGPTTLFVASTIFTLIIIRDSIGVRRQSGKQAGIINKITQLIYKGKQKEKLNETTGHTITQTVIGAILGIIIAIVIV
jgi:uncharacterized protein